MKMLVSHVCLSVRVRRDFCTIGLLWGLWVSGYAAPAVVVAAKRMVMGKESTLNMVVWRDEEERQKTK